MDEGPSSRGVLYLVATPIGNREDITLRALRVLREVDRVLAEDTRRTRTLLRALGVEARSVERLDDHVIRQKTEQLVRDLVAGQSIALVSDAGTPVVSDPGAWLVRHAAEAGVRVEAVPGASAALAALAVSGLSGSGFRFVGFLPREGTERRTAMAHIAHDELATVLFESPARTHQTLEELCVVCGPGRSATLARELTKTHEEVRRGSLAHLRDATRDGVLGEVTLVIGGYEPRADERETDAGLDRALDAALAAGMKPSDAAREVARALGMPRAEVYQRALERRPRGR